MNSYHLSTLIPILRPLKRLVSPQTMKQLYITFFLLLGTFFSVAQKTPIVFQNDTSIEEKAIEVLIDSSTINYDRGNYVASLKFNLEILTRAKAINNAKLISKGHRYLGYDYLAIEDTLSARKSFENSQEYAKLSNNDISLGESFMDLGNLYSSAYEEFTTAYIYYDKAIAVFKKAKDTTSLTKAYFNTLVNTISDQNHSKTFYYLNKLENPSLYKFLNTPYKNHLDLFWSQYHLYAKEDYDKAIAYALKGIPLAKKEKYYNILETFYLNLSESYFIKKQYKEAAEYGVLYEEIHETNTERRIAAISESVSAKYQLAEYKKDLSDAEEKAQLQEEIASNKNTLSNVLIIVCIIGFLVLAFLYVAYLKRKDLNTALIEKNKEYLEAKKKSDHLAKAKSKFFSTVSHELRTPLYGVIGLSTILLENDKLKEHQKDLKSLKFSADYLLALINDVLQINKIDSNSSENQSNPFNIRELIRSIEMSFEYIRLQNNNDIILEVAPETPNIIIGNSVRLSQILMNLVGNACKFTEDGTITIQVKPLTIDANNTTLHFSIKDTGIGIAKDKQSNMFDEFTQIENLDYTYQGTGLGLSIVKKLLTLSNSEITLESELGKGSQFSFSLDYEIATDIGMQKDAIVLDIATLNGKKILVAEDNRINQIVTKKILESKDIICSIANNGEEAITLFKENEYDLILMDLNMPVKNGFDASIAIRKINDTIPIVALTAVEVEEVRNEIYFAGMDDIIIKPYDTEKFIATIIVNMTGDRKQKDNTSKKAI